MPKTIQKTQELTIDQKIANALKETARLREESFDFKACALAKEQAEEQDKKSGDNFHRLTIDYSKFYKLTLTHAAKLACTNADLPQSLVELIVLNLTVSWNDSLGWANTYSNIL